MESERVVSAEVAADTEVMAAVEDGPVEQFILADISTDGAYIRIPLEDAVSLDFWR